MLFPSSSEVCVALKSTKVHLREQVDPKKHAIVDSSLKHFKACAQRLSTLMTLFTEESRLLERIYYKNKNQQRSSLFWKKYEEIRRLVFRILELNPEKLVETLRYSFYASQSPKALRTSWTQVPDSLPLYSMLRLLVGIGRLLNHSNNRFGSISSTLVQQLRTLSFAPLVLTIISMLSRFNYFISGFREAFRILWTGTTNLIEGLYQDQPDHRKPARWLELTPFNSYNQKGVQKISEKEVVSVAADEDTGSRIITPDSAMTATTMPILDLPVVSETHIVSSSTVSFVRAPDGVDLKATGGPEPTIQLTKGSSNDPTVLNNNKKRKKKKRDEIDDIFCS